MEDQYPKALKEVYVILENVDQNIRKKIPKKFKKFVVDNMDIDYKVNIDFNYKNWEETIMEETKQILALIYRDYLVTKEEREELLKEEFNNKKVEEQKLREKYNPNNIFNNKKEKNNNSNDINSNNQILKANKINWFKKFIYRIREILKDR